ncbi:beta-N-acetylhexosaminidase [Deinococcus sp. JMULE3]|uniref:beta-N-acetylhexosaminidase n=1 Tax=Deinococcus sp. JMULE3 TaxID=2518341 RepID=UPI0015759368|nr:beta-N-acetylhexosaminidase [Deinococcus sp. JMULE3]NTY02468.1 beta-N-acetylhexosaminidase [Deinococcus sp. JMULE3]
MTAPEATLIIDLGGPDLTPQDARWLRTHPVGGVCLFTRNITTPERTARLIADIRDALGRDVLIATDQEGGAVLRRLDVPPPPTPQALAELDEAAAYRAGQIAARGLLDLGINWNFAPSLDVNVDPLNPVIGERSFGADPHLVARLGVAWAQGSEAAGVLSAVKHYPGHGDTRVDSHEDLPVVNKSRAQLETAEWIPFRAAARAGLGSVMTAHILYPQLDPARPATLSPTLLSGVLRGEWGYGGVIVTDAMDMGAIARRWPQGRAAGLALAAGADAVLVCGHGDRAVTDAHVLALREAAASGVLDEARVDEAANRLDRATLRFPGQPRAYSVQAQREDQGALLDWARAAVRWSGTPPRLPRDEPLLLFVPSVTPLGGPYGDHLTPAQLNDALRPHFPHLRTVDLLDAEATEEASRDLPRAPALLVSAGRWGVTGEARRLASGLRGRALHLCLWNADDAGDLPLPALITHGFRPPNLRALVEALAECSG